MKCLQVKFLAVVLLLATSLTAAPADDFYVVRLRAGRDAYKRGQIIEAVDEFRIACFGLLDQPVLLSEGLARLALAQEKAGRSDDLVQTLERFQEVERRFGPWGKGQVAIEPELKAAFEALVRLRLGPEAIQGVAASSPVQSEAFRILALPPAERTKALEAKASAEPGEIRWPLALGAEALSANEGKQAEKWAGKALAIDAANPDALVLRARARVRREKYADAAADFRAVPADRLKVEGVAADAFVAFAETGELAAAKALVPLLTPGQKTRPDVMRANQKVSVPSAAAEPAAGAPGASAAPAAIAATTTTAAAAAAAAATGAAPILESVRQLVAQGKFTEALAKAEAGLKADPTNRDLHLAALESATLSRDYRRATEAVRKVEPFGSKEDVPAFYASVALFETGSKAEARVLAKQAGERIQHSPFVDYYLQKILGGP